jgi:ribosomal protein S27AE
MNWNELMQEGGCPNCGSIESFGQIFSDNLPRGMSDKDSVGYEMLIECPNCGAGLVVTDQGEQYSIRKSSCLDRVGGMSYELE